MDEEDQRDHRRCQRGPQQQITQHPEGRSSGNVDGQIPHTKGGRILSPQCIVAGERGQQQWPIHESAYLA